MPTKPTELSQKNNFVLALREYLKSKYQTKHHYTYGEDDFEGRKDGNAYFLFRKDPSKPKDINGFCFRKDLCFLAPTNAMQILQDIHDFSKKYKNLERILNRDDQNLVIKIGNVKYLVVSYIGQGYADDIDVYFMKLPTLLRKEQ